MEACSQFPVQLHRTKRGFGITAAIVTAIAVSAVAAATAGIALSQNTQQADVVKRVSNALDIQNQINGHVHSGLPTLNQQMVLVQEQLDLL